MRLDENRDEASERAEDRVMDHQPNSAAAISIIEWLDSAGV